ncbi:MAG: acyl-CoA thioesterase [Rhodanobacteraceae bacterium]|nr:MAG: acyl-CoA thioesterase [Rhodanobacteraceae bacterium]
MTDDTKQPPRQRAPRKRTKAKPPARPQGAAPQPSQPAAAATVRAAAPAPAQPTRARKLAVIAMHVRWRDLDAFNHVNNSSYLTFLEEARLQWLRGVPGEWFNEHAMPVMAAVELHYLKPITWPAEVDVQLSCARLGNTSMTVANRIVDRNDPACVYADGTVVLVWIDPATGQPVSLPDAIRVACQ